MTICFQAITTFILLATAGWIQGRPSQGTWEDDGNHTGVENENITFVIGLKINFDHAAIAALFNPNSTSFRNFTNLEDSRAKATEGLDECRTSLSNILTGLGLTAKNITPYNEY